MLFITGGSLASADRTCSDPCANSSVNLGDNRWAYMQCCSENLCNNQSGPGTTDTMMFLTFFTFFHMISLIKYVLMLILSHIRSPVF